MDIRGSFWNAVWRLRIRFKRIRCWFTGHDERSGGEDYTNEPDRCWTCYIEWPQDVQTLPTHLSNTYAWFVLRDWSWFERLDLWLSNNHGNRLPRWWEY